VQVYTAFEAVVSATSTRPEAARRWIEFVTAPSAVPVLEAKGLKPG
jgi:hypothetical protein